MNGGLSVPNPARSALIFAPVVLSLVSRLTHGPLQTVVLLVLAASGYLAFSGLRVLLRDVLSALLAFIAVVLVTSFLPAAAQKPVIAASLIVSAGLCLWRREALIQSLREDFSLLASPGAASTIWFWTGMLVLVLFQGVWGAGGFYALDGHHPVYELSNGQCYFFNLFSPPDLSFAGKHFRYHFLSTRLPFFVSRLTGLPLLDASYFILPVLVVVLAAVLVHILLRRAGFRVPLLFLLFFPTLFLGPRASFDGLAQRLFPIIPSYGLGLVLMILSLLFARAGRWKLFYAAAALLLVVKASFFLVLAGGIVVLSARSWDVRKLFQHGIILGVIFVVGTKVWLSGAHGHNQWILFPAFWYDCVDTSRFSLGFPVLVKLFLATSFWCFCVWPAVQILRKPSSNMLSILAAVSLVGNLGLLVTEVTEDNSCQFAIAASIATVLVLWEWWRARWLEWSAPLRRVAVLSMFLLMGTTASNVLPPVAAQIGRWQRGESSGVLSDGRWNQVYPRDVVDAYTWLGQNSAPEAVVFFGKHYEYLSGQAHWWPDSSFIRSALSGRQMWIENFKYKGIGMEPDFPERFAKNLAFYSIFVLSSPRSRQGLALFPDPVFSKEAQPPLNEGPVVGKKVLYYLSLGKKWSWVNRFKDVHYGIRRSLEELSALRPGQDWAEGLIQSAEIDYVVLEQGDAPGEWLNARGKEVYRNSTVTILYVGGN